MNKNQRIAKENLDKNNINSSYYRIIILENMIKIKGCLKANDLYELIHKNAPTISKATLYNNLLLFEDKNIINKISFGQDDIRYCLNDGKFYIYFKCTKCDTIYKLNDRRDCFKPGLSNGHKIKKFNIIAYGICKKCL